MFGADGAPLHFGRSLTYRFAASAAVSLGAVTGHTPLTPGASRRIASGALRHFLDRGALTSEGLLSLGWYGPHEASLQEYSGPASPYWASKAFVALLAPADHALWTDTEEPAPVEEADRVLSLPGPGLLLQATRADGTVRLHNHGSDHVRPHEGESAADDDPHYGRLAYSTRTGPTARANVADNHLSVEVVVSQPQCAPAHPSPGRGAQRRLGLGRLLAPARVRRGPADGAGPESRERHGRARQSGAARAPCGGGAARIAGHPHRLGHRTRGADGVRPARPVRLGRPGPGAGPRAAGHRLDPLGPRAPPHRRLRGHHRASRPGVPHHRAGTPRRRWSVR